MDYDSINQQSEENEMHIKQKYFLDAQDISFRKLNTNQPEEELENI